jgi:folate-dependent phosphoribosylglycinamide formyltransferase PurN
MTIRIALITSDQQRHRWLASQLAKVGDLVAVVSESKPENSPARTDNSNVDIAGYFQEREAREAHWFSSAAGDLAELTQSLLRCPWGQGNNQATYDFLVKKNPDLIFLFGSSIIRDPILSRFQGRVVNMHLGLSPYYRGSSTNFWPLVDGVPECVGVTVHHATLKVDGGNILLQARPDVALGDSSHDLGCKSIIAGASLLQKVVASPACLAGGTVQSGGGKLCRRDDFTLDALCRMRNNFSGGMIDRYLQEKNSRDAQYPIIDSITD